MRIMAARKRLAAGFCALLLALAMASATGVAEAVLRFIPQADLRSFHHRPGGLPVERGDEIRAAALSVIIPLRPLGGRGRGPSPRRWEGGVGLRRRPGI